MAINTAKAKDFEFKNIINSFGGYVSSLDKTNIKENYLVRGSQNVYKRLSGTVAVRPGQKRLGVANTVASPCYSKYVWNTSWGMTYVMVVSNGNLYVVKDNVWYSLLSGLTKTRYVFDKWWDNTEKKDRCLFVNGTSDIFHWSGGFAQVNGLNNIITAINSTPTAGGTGYTVGDILTITSGSANATVKVTIVASGAVSQVTLVSGGDGYTVGAGNATTGGTGNGCTINITAVASPTVNTITLKDTTKSWQQMGFASNTAGEKKFMIGTTEYTYTGGESTSTLTGVTPSVAGVADNSYAIQSVMTKSTTPNVNQLNDFIKVINNQAYIGSYTSRLCYISSSTDFTNYVVPTPRLAGSPELLTLDGTLKGIGVRQGKATIGYGSGSWAVISFTDISNNNIITQKTNVDVKPVSLLQAPLAHEFIDSTGDNIIYLGQDNQVHNFGDFNNLFVSGYPSLSQEIARELTKENFTGGGLRCIGEFVYLTAPNSGKTYLYQVRSSIGDNGAIGAERLWHSPFVWNATFIDQIDGNVVAFSNANPQIYQVWDTGQYYDDSPSGEQLPYTCVMAMGYRGGQRRQGLWSFSKQFTEGYISSGTQLNGLMNYNYQGATDSVSFTINSIKKPAYTFGAATSSLGEKNLGDESLGEGGVIDIANDPDSLFKFKVINSMSIINVFEWQPIYYSDTVNSNWEILALGTNAEVELEQVPGFIINKLKN